MKHKTLCILLILCLVAPLATSYVFFKFQKKQIRKEVKKKMIDGMSKDELVFLKFSNQEKQTLLNFIHSNEFEYNGEMYDIVESKIVGDTTYYRVWWDHEETKLSKQLNQLVYLALGTNTKHQENNKRLNHFFKSLFFKELNGNQIIAFKEVYTQNPLLQNIYTSVSTLPAVPPPEKS